MNSIQLLEQAQKGDSAAIAALLNQKLRAAGLIAQVKVQSQTLKVLLESVEPPHQSSALALVKRVLLPLRLTQFTTLHLYGRRTGDSAPLWQEISALEWDAPEPSAKAIVPSPRPTKRSRELMEGFKFTVPRTGPEFIQLAFVGFLTFYVWGGAASDEYAGFFRLLHGGNLIIHEAGHFVFSMSRLFGETFWGEIIYFAGGSILQIVIPVVIAVSFWRSQQFYAVAIALFWVSENFFDVAIYVKDASAMALPLLSENLIHDWNYILDQFNALQHDQAIGGLFQFVGYTLMGVACLWGIYSVVCRENWPFNTNIKNA